MYDYYSTHSLILTDGRLFMCVNQSRMIQYTSYIHTLARRDCSMKHYTA